MRAFIPYCLFVLTLLVTASCSEKKGKNEVLSLNPEYNRIHDLVSIANCSSPFGDYITEVHSFSNGNCFFLQKFEDPYTSFKVNIDSMSQGYVLDEKNIIIDTLSQQDVQMIRSHEIHKMNYNPEYFFTKLKFKSDITHLDKKHMLYIGKDIIGNPVRVFYEENKKLITKIEFRDPKNTIKIIELFYDTWVDSKYGKMPKKIHIVQAKKDTFFFDFTSLEISGSYGNDVVI